MSATASLIHVWGLTLVFALTGFAAAAGDSAAVPFVKQWRPDTGHVRVDRVAIGPARAELANEAGILRECLDQHQVLVGDDGPTIQLDMATVEFPHSASAYASSIQDQGYRIRISASGVLIQGRTPAGVFYGIQTLRQFIDKDGDLPCGEIIDWPDLAYRGIMVDPARANENADYYERLIRFCGRRKINRLHMHLTDDQNVCLYNEEYGALLHPQAWRVEQLRPLVLLARRHHIELIPEIESLGHARVFLRHPEARDILHQTTENKPAGSWTGTDQPGYTNVLCPASAKTYEYLKKMYARAADSFPYPELHIGCDEVDMTACARCEARFPGISHADWFLKHVLRCRDLAAGHDRRTALWGDMLLQHRRIAERLPRTGVVIYDWHYGPNVSEDSLIYFKQLGFEVVACPALMCYPHMILPSEARYENIRRFADIARVHDARGVNTTIWIPTRYMSDVLWPGIAYAAAYAWAGSNWDEAAFYRGFAREQFDSAQGAELAGAWQELCRIDWPLKQFKTSCWIDDETLAAAQEEAGGALGAAALRHLSALEHVRGRFERIRADIKRNRVAWDAIEHSADILAYTLQHFMASAEVRRDGRLNQTLLRELDSGCVQAIEWLEADWNRNRFADDPYKADLNHTGQHLLHRFRQMHAFHQRLLKQAAEER